jgi:predicted negative regulator of RcsB-dependent stress response
MKFSHLLALTLGLTIATLPSLTIAQPTPIAAKSDRLPIPQLKPNNVPRSIDQVLQAEAKSLSQPPSEEQFLIVGTVTRTLQAEMMERGVENTPSKAALPHLEKWLKQYPKSVAVAGLYGASLADGESDDRIEQIFTDLMTKHRNHPMILQSYQTALQIKYKDNLPAPIVAKLDNLYDRVIAQHPQILSLYIDRSTKSPAKIFARWQAAAAKMPNNPQVAVKFAELIIETQSSASGQSEGQSTVTQTIDPQVVAMTAQQLETAIDQFPQEIALYETYTNLYYKSNNPQKALPILQAGLTKGTNTSRLHNLMGNIYLLSGDESAAISSYQKVIQAKAPLCQDNMAETFSGLKSTEHQRTLLKMLIQSLEFDREDSCVSYLAQIGYDPTMNQRFGQEMIAAIRPIAESKNNLAVHAVLLGLMQQQQQYEQIVQLGPKFLAADGVQLEVDEFVFYAEGMPRRIAEAHEKLGNLDQAAKFYALSGEYEKQIYRNLPISQRISYAANWHLGRIAWQQGKAPKAIELLQTVTAHRLSDWKLTGSDGKEVSYRALAHNLLGEIFQSQGQKAAAKQQFEAAVKADAQFQTPKDNLVKLNQN